MTVTVKSKTAGLIVPPSIRRQAGIRAGDRLEFKVSSRKITIVAKPPVEADEYTPAQRRVIDREIANWAGGYSEGAGLWAFRLRRRDDPPSSGIHQEAQSGQMIVRFVDRAKTGWARWVIYLGGAFSVRCGNIEPGELPR